MRAPNPPSTPSTWPVTQLVASAIEWLLDPATSWVTGQVLGVDGGLGALKGRPA